MSTNCGPSRRATTHAAHRPTECDVAEARFTEAKAITDALMERLGRERSELAGAAEGERVRVERRVQVTKLELVDARAYEDRSFARWERERSVARGEGVSGVRGAPGGGRALRSVSSGSGRLASHTAPSVEVSSDCTGMSA